MKIKHLFLSLIMVLCLTQVYAQEKGQLIVLVKNMDVAEGTLRIGLYNSEETFMKSSFMATEAVVDQTEEIAITFHEVPFGTYTFSLYHDQNLNGDMDTNFMGIPTEDYAFSNNAKGKFGPPGYEECAFKLDTESLIQTINLN